MTKEELTEQVSKDLITIGIYMHQTLGFPKDVYMDIIDDMNLLEQASFTAQMRTKYQKAFK